MIFGFNTDVPGPDAVYHVQTEDRGEKNPVIDSIVYVGGKIVDRVRTPYVPQQTNQGEVEAMVRNQHRQLVESIRSGTFTPSLQPAPPEPPTAGYTIRLLNQQDVSRDGQLCFEFSVWSRSQKAPVKGASLEVKWTSAGAAPQQLSVKTGEDGKAVAYLPMQEGGEEATLLVRASGGDGHQVVKYCLRANRTTEIPPRPDSPMRRQMDFGE